MNNFRTAQIYRVCLDSEDDVNKSAETRILTNCGRYTYSFLRNLSLLYVISWIHLYKGCSLTFSGILMSFLKSERRYISVT